MNHFWKEGSLARYGAFRLATAVLVLVGSMTLLCCLTLIVPGDPATILLGPRATPEAAALLREQMGLNLPLYERVALFFANALRGDLGVDVINGRPVAAMVFAALPNTILLAVSAIGLAVLIGIPIGCYAAVRQGSLLDQGLAVVSVGLVATPSYVVAITLLYCFSVRLGWFPVLGAGDPGNFVDQLHHLVLPTIALAVGWIGYIARLVRSSLLEVLNEPYIRTARAYGQPERRIVMKYALKLACIPTVAILGVGIGELMGGALFVEIIFNRPGLGSLIFDAIRNRNYPIVQGGILVVVSIFVLVNLLVDFSYAWLDPRVRENLGRAGGGA
ncbi:ABC transporter permease [Mesorhizobium sp. LHD-90]|uniref:ABC transporter permease n=1 Tax=Mesorhizobium sp. LHD-90 TaxID=3071414 RepID=UPI0027DF1016|nr:ABC transporter permease [Mesorhizobium sp. LHD-90]MDQ6433267.1 ABC transporter permease [Mesorhizobium sp. LHD-90]